MTHAEREKITDLKKCNFNAINEYFKEQSEIRKSRSKEEKKVGLFYMTPFNSKCSGN